MGLMHASILNMFPDIELAAICEKNSFIRKYCKKMIPGIEMVENLEDLYGMQLDAICITTPPSSHFPIIKAVYEKKIANHVFSEKPLTIDYPQAEMLCSLSESHGGITMVGYHLRHSVTYKKAKEMLEKGEIGNLSFFEAYAYSSDFIGITNPTQPLKRGGVLGDSGSHVIDLALWLLGNMEVLSAETKSIVGGGSEDEAFIEVITHSGLKGKFKISWCKEGYRLPEMGLMIKGSIGIMFVNQDYVQVTLSNGESRSWYKHDLNDNVPFFIGGSEYQRQDELLVRSVRDNLKVEPSFHTASLVQKLIDQAKLKATGLKVA